MQQQIKSSKLTSLPQHWARTRALWDASLRESLYCFKNRRSGPGAFASAGTKFLILCLSVHDI